MTAIQVDHAVDVLARRQHGVFSRAQVLAAGGTRRSIDSRLASGRWLRLAPAVYALPSHMGTWERSLMAAVLGEPVAVVGGKSAAALHHLSGFRPGRPEIVVPRAAQNRSPVALVRRRDGVRSTVVDQLPVLTVVDTFFAIGGLVSLARIAAALDDALAAGRLTIEEMQERFIEVATTNSRGLKQIRPLIEARSEQGYVPPQSVLEGMLYGVLDRPAMPPYQRQAPLPWSPHERVDAMLVDAPVILESDGRRWHTRVDDFERDRRRDRQAALHGYLTLRYGYRDLAQDSDRVEREIRAIAGPATNVHRAA